MNFKGYSDLTMEGIKEKVWLKVEICEKVMRDLLSYSILTLKTHDI